MGKSSVDVEVRLKLKDGATEGVAKAGRAAREEAEKTATTTERAAQKAAAAQEREAQKATAAIERAAQKAAEAAEKSASKQRSNYERLSQAREVLGIRSEQLIQREIQRTEAAYERLTATGRLSAEAQARAYDAMQRKVQSLTHEMGKLTEAEKRAAKEAANLERGQKVLQYGAAGLAGGAAAAYTLKAPAQAAMAFDERLANMANTAYAERDATGRKIGMKTLEDAVNKARRYGGGTRDQAAEALDTMIASGTVSNSEAITMLPGIMKAATGANTNANDLATIAIRAKQSFKIAAEDVPSILSAALAAGQAGGFELKDMAKWLPQQMAMAGNLGLSGKEGFAKLAAWNQASVITAGSKDEAGNNLRDLLNELNTPHFRKFIGEQYYGNGDHVKRGAKEQMAKDIDALYLDYQGRGVDKVSATIDMAEKIFSRDKRYQELKTQLAATKDNDRRRQILESMAAQVQGTDIGKIFHNQQSLMAFLGLMNNKAYTADVLSKVQREYSLPAGASAVDVAQSVIADTSSFKLTQAKEDSAMAQKSAMDGLTPAIGRVAQAFSDLASKHPLLIGTTTLAATALGALAGAAGVATLAMGGKVPGTGAIGSVAGRMAGSSIGKAAMRAGKVGSVAGVASLAGDWALEKAFGEDSAISRYGSSGLSGAAMGATIGSVVPVLGTGVGALIGGGLGLAWEGIKDLLKPAEQKPVSLDANLQVGLAPGLVLQSQTVQSSGGNVQMNTGNAWHGAPG